MDQVSGDRRSCPLAPYIILTGVMSFFPLVTFLRLPVLLKTALILPMAGVFLLVIEWTHKSLFLCYDSTIGSLVPLHLIAVIAIGHFVLVLLTHGRQVEWTARLDFLWNLQVRLSLHLCLSLRLILLSDSRLVIFTNERICARVPASPAVCLCVFCSPLILSPQWLERLD